MEFIKKHFLGKLLVATQEAEAVRKNVQRGTKEAGINIKINNPEDGIKGCSKIFTTIVITVCSVEGFKLITYYDKKILIPVSKELIEGVIFPYIEGVLNSRKVAKVSNFMDSDPYFESINKPCLILSPNIFTTDRVVVTTPLNDFGYLSILEEANKRALIPNGAFIERMLELQEMFQKEPEKLAEAKKKTK